LHFIVDSRNRDESSGGSVQNLAEPLVDPLGDLLPARFADQSVPVARQLLERCHPLIPLAPGGLELCRVDLSAVVSKWIAETEKNLRRAFDAAFRPTGATHFRI
jgi:hypothetical protein